MARVDPISRLPRPHFRRGLLRLAAALPLVGSLAFSLTLAQTARAAGFTVTVCTANSPATVGSLDYELAQAQASSGNTITFSCRGQILLDQTLTITTTLTLDGTGQIIALDGQGALQDILVESGANLTVNGLTIQDGFSTGGGGLENDFGTLTLTNSEVVGNTANLSGNGAVGGGIENFGGTLTLTNVRVTANSTKQPGNGAAFGGGIYSDGGTVTLTDSGVVGNTTQGFSAAGGGIYSLHGALTLTNSVVAGNVAAATVTTGGSFGGGIASDGPLSTLTLINSTVFDNQAGTAGGIGNSEGTATLANCTVTGNMAPGSSGDSQGGGVGAGIFNNGGTLTLTNCDVANNTAAVAGGGIENAGTMSSGGSIVANNTTGNCDGSTITDSGYNLESGTDCGFTSTGSVQNTDPKLDTTLANNGGPTQTLALLGGSPAIDAIPSASGFCPATDQRGVTRPDNGEAACDIGAYEFVDDADLALTNVPANLVVNATGPQGAVVTYTSPTVVDEDSSLPTVSCVPSSGSTFAIGATTVTCTVSDDDDTNSPVTASFTVTVQGAAPQVQGLISVVNSFHLSKGLQNALDAQLQVAMRAINAGHKATACIELTGFVGFVGLVRSLGGFGITASQANQMIAGAKNIKAVLGC